ncbi:conserved hypothetical protein [Culex quinquefasciatus]|uniref:Uncharacterized protein n=1 Tax=Culex quinquefasciatus TaxID=7176 RepID=B0XHR2_CULQU|nr:conserved hypothetical protein [Culex quinquefasciatus]|eukprot:XP_001869184.1 conserved hypothetical protein [Culex quinquefasciatus]
MSSETLTYQEGSQTEWMVFFRPTQKPLYFVQITKDVQKHYPGVVECTKLNKSKLRVIVNSAVRANQIVTDLRFSIEYRVWILAHKVVIDGEVTDDGLTLGDIANAVGASRTPNFQLWRPSSALEEIGQRYHRGGPEEVHSYCLVPGDFCRVSSSGLH